ncbi:MAG: M23 family metallopeptidase [Candidatus Kerfeldbacteria bacterium]|nr:M23 family metallopeptidase [Candidatus Kerfeldbacteria bacterium]
MSIRLKQLLVTALVRLLRLAALLLKASWWLGLVLANPFIVILKFILRPVVVMVYRQYVTIMAQVRRSAFMQNKILFIFGNKYFIHVIVVTITFFVASTNLLQAKENFDPEFGKRSGLYKIVKPGDAANVDIVEQGLPSKTKTKHSYVSTDGSIIANIPAIDPSAQPLLTVGDQLQLANQDALVGSSVIETSVGVRAGITEYKVRQGDTVSDIANRFGVTVSTLLWSNNLTSSSYIKPGDTLKILPASGITHTVAEGDTLEKIVEKYKGDLEETVRVNDIGEDRLVAVGTEIVVVDGTPPPPPPPPVQSSYYGQTGTYNVYQQRNVPNGAITGGKLNWPVGCRNTPTTYWGHANRARDIPCPVGTPIYAAEAGTAYITFTGQWGHGYGNAIDVRSANGLVTRYAHLSSFNITNGQSVSRGQVIGFVGMTGRTSGPHIHFEVIINGVAYDPIGFIM